MHGYQAGLARSQGESVFTSYHNGERATREVAGALV